MKNTLALWAALLLATSCTGPLAFLAQTGAPAESPVAAADARLVLHFSSGASRAATLGQAGYLTLKLTPQDGGASRFATAANDGTGTFTVPLPGLVPGLWTAGIRLFDSQAAGTLLFYTTQSVRIDTGRTTSGDFDVYEPGTLKGITLVNNDPVSVDVEDGSGPAAPGSARAVVQGSRFNLNAVVNGSAGTPLKDQGVVWSTSDPKVVSVGPTGTVEALGPGTAVITGASRVSRDIAGTFSVRVDPAVFGFWHQNRYVSGSPSRSINAYLQLTQTGTDASGTFQWLDTTSTNGQAPAETMVKGTFTWDSQTLFLHLTHQLDAATAQWAVFVPGVTPADFALKFVTVNGTLSLSSSDAGLPDSLFGTYDPEPFYAMTGADFSQAPWLTTNGPEIRFLTYGTFRYTSPAPSVPGILLIPHDPSKLAITKTWAWGSANIMAQCSELGSHPFDLVGLWDLKLYKTYTVVSGDSTAPEVVYTSPIRNYNPGDNSSVMYAGGPQVAGYAEDLESGVAKVEYSLDGGTTWLQDAVVVLTTPQRLSWTLPVLSQTGVSLRVRAVNGAGTVSTFVNRMYKDTQGTIRYFYKDISNIDLIPPTLVSITPTPGSDIVLNNVDVHMELTAEMTLGNDFPKVALQSAPGDFQSVGYWSNPPSVVFTVNRSDAVGGSLTYQVHIEDRAGNALDQTLTYNVPALVSRENWTFDGLATGPLNGQDGWSTSGTGANNVLVNSTGYSGNGFVFDQMASMAVATKPLATAGLNFTDPNKVYFLSFDTKQTTGTMSVGFSKGGPTGLRWELDGSDIYLWSGNSGGGMGFTYSPYSQAVWTRTQIMFQNNGSGGVKATVEARTLPDGNWQHITETSSLNIVPGTETDPSTWNSLVIGVSENNNGIDNITLEESP